jgi:acetyltransferase
MIIRPKAWELIVGIADDPTFGPVIAFGQGGTAVEVIGDKALALPPLDLKMASDLIARTRISRLLQGYRDVPAAKVGEVALTLVKLAQLAADFPEVRELDINPLLADQNGALALDARIAIAPRDAVPMFQGRGYSRFAVRPYPKEWEQRLAAFQNLETVTVSFLGFSVAMRIAILVLVVYVLGAITGGSLFALLRRSYRGSAIWS